MTTFAVLLLALFACFFVIAIDDIAFDVAYWWNVLRGRARVRSIRKQDLDAVPQGRCAVMIAAWQEADVIDRMITYNATVIDYACYDVFVGTYPNDPETQAKVDAVAAFLPNVFKVVTAQPGPTSKADCLNHVITGILRRERETGEPYEFVVMHDPEDVLHPLEMKVANYHVQRSDLAMIQLPILPLRVRPWEFTPGSYLDEFAEVHTKDLHVREWIGGFVPSAGVATLFRRAVLDELASLTNGRPFATSSLTEDYEIGLKLALGGHRTAFIRTSVLHPTDGTPADAHDDPLEPTGAAERARRAHGGSWSEDVVATRAHFPETFYTSVRQRTRWTIGIAFQGWRNWKWPGNWATRWLLVHDRKAPLSFLLLGLAYLLFAYGLAHMVARRWFDQSLAPLVPDTPLFHTLFVIAMVLMGNRMLQRFLSTRRVYGVGQGLLSIVRQPWANLINLAAAYRAAKQFFGALLRNETIAWDKTRHFVPSVVTARLQLGEIFIELGMISPEQLMQALRRQREQPGARLGEILLARHHLSKADLARALDEQRVRRERSAAGPAGASAAPSPLPAATAPLHALSAD